jgi:hypothetical protein
VDAGPAVLLVGAEGSPSRRGSGLLTGPPPGREAPTRFPEV